MSVKMKVGHKYEDGYGQTVEIHFYFVDFDENKVFAGRKIPFSDTNNMRPGGLFEYYSGGRFWANKKPTPFNLVKDLGPFEKQVEEPEKPACLVYSVDEVCALFGICRSNAYDLISAGKIPHFKLGRKIMIPRIAAESMLQLELKKIKW